jgi:hypothetical protein
VKKKLQIFISSTFSDLQKERQAAVEAVLRAGHIPAGMELFSASNESQLEIIKRWIDDSDVYMLILGGRYGSIEKSSGLAYTEIEYRYALERGKPVFAIVVSDELLAAKVKEFGLDVVERKAVDKYEEFKKLVLSKICRFFDDVNEIKLSIFESLLDIQNRFQLKGWVKFEEVPDLSIILNQLSDLKDENSKLKKDILEKGSKENLKFGFLSFGDLMDLLASKKIEIPTSLTKTDKPLRNSYLELFISNYGIFNTGLDNLQSSGESMNLLYAVASKMMAFGLIEQVSIKRGQSTYSQLKTSNEGKRFIAECEMRMSKEKKEELKSKASKAKAENDSKADNAD